MLPTKTQGMRLIKTREPNVTSSVYSYPFLVSNTVLATAASGHILSKFRHHSLKLSAFLRCNTTLSQFLEKCSFKWSSKVPARRFAHSPEFCFTAFRVIPRSRKDGHPSLAFPRRFAVFASAVAFGDKPAKLSLLLLGFRVGQVVEVMRAIRSGGITKTFWRNSGGAIWTRATAGSCCKTRGHE